MTIVKKVRCNMCEKTWDDDEYIPYIFDIKTNESYHGCSNCLTDEYLMDLDLQLEKEPTS